MDKQNSRYQLPSVDKILNDPEITKATRDLPRSAVVNAIRSVLSSFRQEINHGSRQPDKTITMRELAPLISVTAREALAPIGNRVINATGVIIHTNLGRAPLAQPAIEAAASIAGGYSDLEYDLETGRRGSRTGAVESLITSLTGASAALVVNNNAAALFFILNALAKEKEVIVSRGELVEIGGSFRLPQIMAAAGCVMTEVGTTNKTKAADYVGALGKDTALMLKVHTSNYRVLGFTASVALDELVELGREHDVSVVEDLGSGNLIKINGLEEPTVSASVKAGADLITFSGDKMLGGPQCGFIIGRADLVQTLRNHPIYRALRLDKMTLAALEATLNLYINDDPKEKIPVPAMLNQSLDTLKERARRLLSALAGTTEVEIEQGATKAKVGGGSLPGQELKSWGLRIKPLGMSEDMLASCLREAKSPIIARIEAGEVVLDMMTVSDAEIESLAVGIRSAVDGSS